MTAPLPLKVIVAVAAREAGYDASDLTGSSRKASVSSIRHMAMMVAHDLRPDVSLRQIGDAFGGRDHSSVSYGISQSRNALCLSPEASARYRSLLSAIERQGLSVSLDQQIVRTAALLDRLMTRRALLRHGRTMATIREQVSQVLAS